jgi:acyl-CoA dehydrogenase
MHALVNDNVRIVSISAALLHQIFVFVVRDFSMYTLQLYSKQSITEQQQKTLLRVTKKLHVDKERFETVWKDMYSLNGLYEIRSSRPITAFATSIPTLFQVTFVGRNLTAN